MYIADPTKPRVKNAVGWYRFQPVSSLMVVSMFVLGSLWLELPAQASIVAGVLAGVSFACLNALRVFYYRWRGYVISVPKSLAEGYEVALKTADQEYNQAQAKTFALWALLSQLDEKAALAQMHLYLKEAKEN